MCRLNTKVTPKHFFNERSPFNSIRRKWKSRTRCRANEQIERIRSFRLEKDYQIIRKEEQEEQIEIRVKSRRNRTEEFSDRFVSFSDWETKIVCWNNASIIWKRFVFLLVRHRRVRLFRCFKESATLANRLIEGQVLNAQSAEETFQLKRDIATLKKQIDELMQKRSSNEKEKLLCNQTELENLRETVDRLASVRCVSLFVVVGIFLFVSERKIVRCNWLLKRKSLLCKKNWRWWKCATPKRRWTSRNFVNVWTI